MHMRVVVKEHEKADTSAALCLISSLQSIMHHCGATNGIYGKFGHAKTEKKRPGTG